MEIEDSFDFKLGGPFRKDSRGSIDCRCSFLICRVFIYVKLIIYVL
jgi:hypothetical protein